MKPVIIDTSSAILLFKSGLMTYLVNHYQALITASVYGELTKQGYPGSTEFKQLSENRQLHILPQQQPELAPQSPYPEMPALNPGEKDTIRQHMAGMGDFIIIDDGRAVKFCMKAALPFINALLFPRILFLMGWIPESEQRQKQAKIIHIGRYSDTIIEMAQKLSEQEIRPFLPS